MSAPVFEELPLRSYRHTGDLSLSSPLLSDDVIEFHAARILLLIAVCGTDGIVDSLTKLAKLDFFVRYPAFLERLVGSQDVSKTARGRTVESSMIRFKYGPWDDRYYQLLPYLEARGLISVSERSKNIEFSISPPGRDIADLLATQPAFLPLVQQMKKVKKHLGKKTGSTLKKMIYKTFEEEVSHRSYGEVI